MGENLDLPPTFTRNCRITSIRNIHECGLTVSARKNRNRAKEGQLSWFDTSLVVSSIFLSSIPSRFHFARDIRESLSLQVAESRTFREFKEVIRVIKGFV
jgi:hypothetical protein